MGAERPGVTVVIPTRNRPHSVVDAVASAARQTLQDIEIIVVIDGPDEATRSALRAIDDPRLRVVQLEANRGAAAARNAGIEAATGEWIALLDDDDQWEPEKLSLQVERARSRNLLRSGVHPVIACRMWCRTPTGTSVAPRRLPRPGEPVSEYLFSRRELFRDEGGVQTSMLLASRRLLTEVPFREDLRRHHEADWILRAAQVPGFALEFVDQVLGVWRTDQPQSRISQTGGWEYSLQWIRGNRAIITPRAYAAFVLTAVAALAAEERAWRACWQLLREAVTYGRPLPVHYALYAAIWLIPRRLRTIIRFMFVGGGERKTRVLVVGQTPPPYHGQAIAIANTLRGSYDAVKLFHVRLEFSRELGEIGRFKVRKLLHVVSVLGRIAFARFRYRIAILYYVPAGPDRIAMWRDFLILLPARRLFRKTVFHFHASGLSTIFNRLSGPERTLFRLAYFRPAAAIRLAVGTEPDAEFVGARSEFIIPNGVEDQPLGKVDRPRDHLITRILWVSNLHESKGIFVLLDACEALDRRNVPFQLDVVGAAPDQAVARQVARRIEEGGLTSRVRLAGSLTGADKWQAFAQADVFCLPTYYEREGMPLVVLEAMQFGLPVVATRWRGIPSMVKDGETGFLVTVRDSTAIADRLEQLIGNPTLRRTLGTAARMEFDRNFTLDTHARRMERAFLSL